MWYIDLGTNRVYLFYKTGAGILIDLVLRVVDLSWRKVKIWMEIWKICKFEILKKSRFLMISKQSDVWKSIWHLTFRRDFLAQPVNLRGLKLVKLVKLVNLKLGHGKLSVSISKGQEFKLGVLKFCCRFKILKNAHF